MSDEKKPPDSSEEPWVVPVYDRKFLEDWLDRISPAPLPEAAKDEKTSLLGFTLPETIDLGDRHDMLHRYARSLKAKGHARDEVFNLVTTANTTRCAKPIKDAELKSCFSRWWSQPNRSDFKEKQSRRSFLQDAAAKGFHLTAKGDSINPRSQHNIRRALELLGVELRFDEFHDRIYVRFSDYNGPYRDEQRNRIWLQIDTQFKVQIPHDLFDIVMGDEAAKNSFHPVRDYLNSLVWDGEKRIDQWLRAYGDASTGLGDDATQEEIDGTLQYIDSVSAIMLLAAVSRVFEPGCKYDEMVVLESEQGFNKSTALRIMCVNDSWFSDDIPLNVDAKQTMERTEGKWILEAAELSGMHASRVEHLKAWLSRSEDGPARRAYGRLSTSKERQFIVVGTTNSHTYLDDSTGNRRFWPIRCGNFKVDELRRDRHQLWAEAVKRVFDGETPRLHPSLWKWAAKQQAERETGDHWYEVIEEEVRELEDGDPENYIAITSAQLVRMTGLDADRFSRVQKFVRNAIKKLGFVYQAIRDENGRSVRGWRRGRLLTRDGVEDMRGSKQRK
jgi:Virulence-associated protein E